MYIYIYVMERCREKMVMEAFMGKTRRLVRVEMDPVNLKRLETRMKIQHSRRQDRRRNVEDEYDVRRQEKRTPTFVKNLL